MKLPWRNSKTEVCSKVLVDKSEQDIPLGSENRRKTDEWFLYIFISYIILLVPFLVYTLIHSDINRYNGYDRCGNICGQKNVRYEEWNCTGQDMTSKQYFVNSKCFTKEEFDEFSLLHKDVGSYYFSEVTYLLQLVLIFNDPLKSLGLLFTLSFFVPLGFSLILAIIFRIIINLPVPTLLCMCWLSFSTITIISWFIMIFLPSDALRTLTVTSVIIFAVSIYMRSQIGLVLTLFRKASKAVFAVRSITINAAMTSILSMLIVALYWIIKFYTATSGILTITSYNRLDYVSDDYMVVTKFLSDIIILWVFHFIIGISSLTASGAIVNRYFLRNKKSLSRGEAIRYHSGTIAMVSILSTIMLLPRLILIVLSQISMLKEFANFCINFIDEFSSNNVYIMTALHGSSVLESGLKQRKLFRSSIGNTEFVRFFVDLIILLPQILITVESVIIFCDYYVGRPDTLFDFVALIGIAYSCTEVVLGPFKVAASTIFFCICQENLLQKEANQPFTISKTEYLDSANKFFEDKVNNALLIEDTRPAERI